MTKSGKSGDSFIQEYIPRVSRTFALTIKFLPRGLRNSVYMSYLLCRVADTLEDTPYMTPEEKSHRLLKLKDVLLDSAESGKFDPNSISTVYKSVNHLKDDEHKLLSESATLFEILDKLPVSQKIIIYRWVAEMAEGMAEYSRLGKNNNGSVLSLKDIRDWDRYCYYVAGTVGHMLTDLFIEHYGFEIKLADGLRALGESFGLGLQKVNVIKDVPDDRKRGLCYLPGDILKNHGLHASGLENDANSPMIIPFVNEIVGMAALHLDDALKYTLLVPRHLKSVRMFLIVPVYFAAETLWLVKTNPVKAMVGPPAKISRGDVTRLVGAAAARIGSNRKLSEYYYKLRHRI